MSDTPRTDKELSGLLWRIENKLPPNWEPIDAAKWMGNFARTLERELNHLRDDYNQMTQLANDKHAVIEQLRAERDAARQGMKNEEHRVNGFIDDNQKLRAEVERLKAERFKCICIFCKREFAKDSPELPDHILTCEKSPLVQLVAGAKKLNEELIELSGAESAAHDEVHRCDALEINDLKQQRDQWRDMATEAIQCCNEVAAYGSCDCDLETGDNPCVFCEANKIVLKFNALEKEKL